MDEMFTEADETLLNRGLNQFGPLTDAEERLLRSVVEGKFAYCGPSHRNDDAENHPTASSKWGKSRTIRVEVISWLCIKESASITAWGVLIHGALITGRLDLSYNETSLRLAFEHCFFADSIDLRQFSGRELDLRGSLVQELELRRANITGMVYLSDGFHAMGPVYLVNAHVGEDLNCQGGIFEGNAISRDNHVKWALDCGSITVNADVFLNRGFSAKSGVNLSNARLGGDLSVSSAALDSQLIAIGSGENTALSLVSAQVRRDVFINNTTVRGQIILDALVAGGDIYFLEGTTISMFADRAASGEASISATNAHVTGNVLFDKAFLSKGMLDFSSAAIDGDFEMDESTIRVASGEIALLGDNATLSGDLSCTGCSFIGSVSWKTAEVSHDAIFTGTVISNVDPRGLPAGAALRMDRCNIRGSVLLEELTTCGYLAFPGCHIGTDLILKRARIRGRMDSQTDNAFSVLIEGASIGRDLDADNVVADGLFSILNTTINGQLSAVGGHFWNPYDEKVENSGVAIKGYRSAIKGPVFLSEGFIARGQVTWRDAVFGANLDARGATFCQSELDLDKSNIALSLSRAQIAGDVLCIQSDANPRVIAHFTSLGKVVLDYMQCAGEVMFDGAHLSNPYSSRHENSGIALNMFSGRCLKGFYLRSGFIAQGEVYVGNSEISQVFSCRGGSFSAPPIRHDSDAIHALAIRGTTIHGTLYLDCGFRIDGILDLSGSQTVNFADDPSSWPQEGKLQIQDFSYAAFANKPRTAKERLNWLRLQNQDPLPESSYRQLAKTLAANGDEEGGRIVLIELEDARTRQPTSPRTEGFLRRNVLGRTIGYGYSPINAIWELAGLSLLGWIIYRRAYLQGNIVPSDKDERAAFLAEGKVSSQYGRFSSFIYSLENTIPIVKFGHADKWRPIGHSGVQPAAQDLLPGWRNRVFRCFYYFVQDVWQFLCDPFNKLGSPPWVRYFLWLQIILGWILATIFIAGLGGITHK